MEYRVSIQSGFHGSLHNSRRFLLFFGYFTLSLGSSSTSLLPSALSISIALTISARILFLRFLCINVHWDFTEIIFYDHRLRRLVIGLDYEQLACAILASAHSPNMRNLHFILGTCTACPHHNSPIDKEINVLLINAANDDISFWQLSHFQ